MRSRTLALLACAAFASALVSCDDATDSGTDSTKKTDTSAQHSSDSTPATATGSGCTAWRSYRASHVSTLPTDGSNFSDTFTFGASGVSERLTLTAPTNPATGSNALEFVVRSATAADSLWRVAFVPTMPSMGHSSPNNVQPTYAGGTYAGQVNFTMSGDWRIYFCLERADGGFADSSHFIDITVSE